MRAELVTTLKRRATELIGEVQRDKMPILITCRGLPRAYLVDAETFELQRRRMQVLEGIARGERAITDGDILTHAEFKKRTHKWLA